jgi:hypothetical protein
VRERSRCSHPRSRGQQIALLSPATPATDIKTAPVPVSQVVLDGRRRPGSVTAVKRTDCEGVPMPVPLESALDDSGVQTRNGRNADDFHL